MKNLKLQNKNLKNEESNYCKSKNEKQRREKIK